MSTLGYINFHIFTLTESEAALLPSDGSYYNDPGIRMNIDNENCVLKNREEVERVIALLSEAADKLWPRA